MLEFGNELFKAVLIASTAFTGITGVVIWQAMGNGSSAPVQKWFGWCLVFSFVIGAAVVLLTVLWFLGTGQSKWEGPLATGLLVIQVYLFLVVPARFIARII